MRSPVYFILNVGNGIVKGTLVADDSHSSKKEVPLRVVYTESVNISIQDVVDPSALEETILIALDSVCQKIKSKGFSRLAALHLQGHISRTLCVLTAPWYISQTSVVRKSEDKTFFVSERIIEDMTKTAEEQVESKYHEQGLTLIEKKIVGVTLNGYTLNSPINKQASSLEISLFLSFAESRIIQKLKKILSKYFYPGTIDFHSLSLTSFSVIRDIHSSTEHCMLMDITNELTELVFVSNGTIAETTTFPYGKNNLIRSIATDLHVTLDIASSMLSLLTQGNIDETLRERVTTSIQKAKKDWISSFSSALSNLSSSSSLPSNFFLITSENTGLLFADFVKAEEYNQFSFAEGSFTVTPIKNADLVSGCAFEEGTEIDVVTALSVFFLKKLPQFTKK